jgi:hypothetical protein
MDQTHAGALLRLIALQGPQHLAVESLDGRDRCVGVRRIVTGRELEPFPLQELDRTSIFDVGVFEAAKADRQAAHEASI